MSKLLAICLMFSVLAFSANAASKDEWKSRTIYQLLTDRFAKTDGDTSPCSNLGDYCGGSWQGITNNLDYIQGMGFDAIWISPVVENTEGGYHGYWAQNFNELNSHFGTEDDFKNLISALHDRGMYIMVDVVANHVGPVGTDFGQITPFNSGSDYHSQCDITSSDFANHNMQAIQNCWLAGLPDLNQENDDVKNGLLSWISTLVSTYGIDGLRIDTVPEVPKDFWQAFASSAGIYQVGEVFDGDMGFVAGYQGQALDATLAYPLYFAIKNFLCYGQSGNGIQSYYQDAGVFPDQTVLGVFIDNHDNARWLNQNGNHKTLENGIVFSMFATGIPIFYYGDEQGYAGGNDPNNREQLWTNMDTSSELYQFTATVVNARKKYQVWNQEQVQRYSTDNFYAFSRGDVLCLFSNTGDNISYPITYLPDGFSNGTKVCNIFYPTSDCITIENGSMTVALDGGETKVYVLASSMEEHQEADVAVTFLQ